jgi:hypothetical protein
MARPQQISLKFPLGGLNRRYDFQSQPPFTTPDCLNVRPVEPGTGRLRGSSRPGLSKVFATRASENPVRLLAPLSVAEPVVKTWREDFSGGGAPRNLSDYSSENWEPGNLYEFQAPLWSPSGQFHAAVTTAMAMGNPTSNWKVDLPDLDTGKPYSIEIVIAPVNERYGANFSILGLADSADPDVTADGFYFTFTPDTDADTDYAALLYGYVGGVETVAESATGDYGGTAPAEITLRVLIAPVSGSTFRIRCFVNDTEIAGFNQTLAAVGHKWGLASTATTLVGLIRSVSMTYSRLGGSMPDAARLFESTAGGARFEDAAGTLRAVSAIAPLRDDAPLSAAQRYGRLYIAEGGDTQYEGSGALNGTNGALTSPSVKSWEDVDPETDLVEISNMGSSLSLALTNGGSSYESDPTVKITGGGGSGAEAVARIRTTAVTITALELQSGGNGYTSAPDVEITGGGGTGATATAQISGVLGGITLTNQGSGYTSPPTISFSGGGGSGAAAVASLLNYVSAITLVSQGQDYSTAPNVMLSGGGGFGAEAAAMMTLGVKRVYIGLAGSGYTSPPTVEFSGGGGSGADAYAVINQATGAVDEIVVTNLGTGYTSAPTVTLSGGGGSGATALVSEMTWRVASIVVMKPGVGYTSAPEVIFSGGGYQGHGASATAAIRGVVGGINITSRGSGYTSAPTVNFAGGGGDGAAGTSSVYASVVGLTLTNAGANYTSAPFVNISGGNGIGAGAIAHVAATDAEVYELVLTNPGSGYTSAPTVTFSGGGGSGAAASATLTATPPAGCYRILHTSGANLYLQRTWYALPNSTCDFRVVRSPKVFDPDKNTIQALIEGSYDDGSHKGYVPLGCSIVVLWRDRLWWSGDGRYPWALYASRQGDPLDYDYGADPNDTQKAFANIASDSGVMGQPITALIPASEDYMLIGCRDSLWVARGDYGSIGNLSRAIGILGRDAWCATPTGEIVFLSRHGLYVVAPGAGMYPVPLSEGPLPRELQNIDTASYHVSLAFDVAENGILISVRYRLATETVALNAEQLVDGAYQPSTNRTWLTFLDETQEGGDYLDSSWDGWLLRYSGTEYVGVLHLETTADGDGWVEGNHATDTPTQFTLTAPTSSYAYWVDWDSKTFWPHKLAHEASVLLRHTPIALGQSCVLLGCEDGHIRRLDDTVATDDEGSVESYVDYGPFMLGGSEVHEGILTELVGVLGKDSGDVTWELYVGDDAESAATSETAFATGTWTAGVNRSEHPRMRGVAARVRLIGTGTPWTIESIVLQRVPTGRLRK